MTTPISTQEQQLLAFLADLPAQFDYNYSEGAADALLKNLFWSLAGGNDEYMKLFFPKGKLTEDLKLSEAQGAVEGAEYTEAARGKRCGHIFKAGEACYSCRTCGTDDTCCLCARCFDSTDHPGHMIRMHISVGNSGCCDCGDDEAWESPLFCTIHSELKESHNKEKGKSPELPDKLVSSIQMTISRVLDYICDVISCSPEQLRQAKTVESVLEDEKTSRLLSKYYGDTAEQCKKFSLVLWNDEKHTIKEVEDQVARACRKPRAEAVKDAWTTDSVGRSILLNKDDVPAILDMAKIIEAIRITVTVRSARDTFREQMCGTIVEWLGDISGCNVGDDNQILRRVICEQLMQPWRQGSAATHLSGLIDDEDQDEQKQTLEARIRSGRENPRLLMLRAVVVDGMMGFDEEADIEDDDDQDMDDDEYDMDEDPLDDDVMMVDARDDPRIEIEIQPNRPEDMPVNWQEDQALEEHEATFAGYPRPPPPPPITAGRGLGAIDTTTADTDTAPATATASGSGSAENGADTSNTATVAATATATAAVSGSGSDSAAASTAGPTAPASTAAQEREATPSDSETGAEPPIPGPIFSKLNVEIPKTPGRRDKPNPPKPGRYWMETPAAYTQRDIKHPAEDVFQRVRLDWLLLFDLRMWKRIRTNLRALYISTVVQVPEFKRLLSLRFSSLYTILAQLYLVGDREPDHSIINLSLQMLTTPSITAEIVERGNFMSSLLAIFYTFLTTRQVGHPWNVSPDAVIAFESGSVTNRRMHHFYQDLKHLFQSPHVQERIRSEPRYLMQFLDLVKLHQGIGPNYRAITEHVEYEAESWFTASLVTRQINVQARSVVEAFRDCPAEDMKCLQRAIRFTTKTVILNSIGSERARFKQCEIKDEVKFKTMVDFEIAGDETFKVVKFVVDKNHISFHHALHYTLSWLIECGKSLPASTIKELMSFTAAELRGKNRLMGKLQIPKTDYDPEDYLMAAFDFPLRVCAWLSQIKANMWVRNGVSLRHQASTYRGISQRDVSHHRDIFLLQTAMVICDQERVLASIIDRFGMDGWVKGIYELKSEAQDDAQHLDVVEDMLHLLIVLLSDRVSLTPTEDGKQAKLLAMRRDLTHVLCFKPLSFSEICNKLPEKYQESESFQRILDEMATFKYPEGVSDVGTFELRPEFIEDIDPYIAHYNKNQREESELAYRKKMALKTGKTAEEIIYEPKPRAIPSGMFENLGGFTSTGVFSQIIYYSLLYPVNHLKWTPSIPSTRVETYLQVVLHLVLLAIHEDKTSEEDMADDDDKTESFVEIALNRVARTNLTNDDKSQRTIGALLHMLSSKEEYKSTHPKIALILKRFKQKRPKAFETAFTSLGVSVDRINAASPAVGTAEEERERKKKAALSRQAKVLAQFQQQQKSFMENQAGIDWGSDLEEDAMEAEGTEDRKHTWKYPTGRCILCQEECDDRRLYGTFALLTETKILRQTDFQDPDLVREASQTPCNLDRSADDVRPFGIAHENRKVVEKLNTKGEVVMAERQTIGKGIRGNISRPGLVANGCGHMMHWTCFEMYYDGIARRHTHQIARHQPENTKLKEFVCPLCKALGNAFIPITGVGVEESYPGGLHMETTLEEFLGKTFAPGDIRAQALEVTITASKFYAAQREAAMAEAASGVQTSQTRSGQDEVRQASEDLRSSDESDEAEVVATSTTRRNAALEATGSGNDELLAAYLRLRGTIQANSLWQKTGTRTTTREKIAAESYKKELRWSDVLIQAIGFSVSAVEIQQRGIEAQADMTLLQKVPEQMHTHLRILSETASSYISIGIQHGKEDGEMIKELIQAAERQHCQLFISQYFGVATQNARRPLDTYRPLLSMDAFIFFVECAYGLVPTQKAELSHILRLCYLSELVKVIFHMSQNIPFEMWAGTLQNRQTEDRAMNNFAEFALAITREVVGIQSATETVVESGVIAETMSSSTPTEPETADGDCEESDESDKKESDMGFKQPGVDSLQGWYMLVQKYALVFLRKSLLFLNIKHGVDFNSLTLNPDADELDRLTVALGLPTFDEMCASLTAEGPNCGWPIQTETVVSGWVKHQVLWPRNDNNWPKSAMVSHPGIYELIGLPKTYDTLIEEASRRKCPTTGKDITDPVICLFCGEMFCSQAICCLKNATLPGYSERTKIGGAQQHMRQCQGNIGVFLNVRKCSTIYLHRLSGIFLPAPFIDMYGETDPQLRHGRQLFLNQKRYDNVIRNTVLTHGIPSLISRRMESEISIGGWDTL